MDRLFLSALEANEINISRTVYGSLVIHFFLFWYLPENKLYQNPIAAVQNDHKLRSPRACFLQCWKSGSKTDLPVLYPRHCVSLWCCWWSFSCSFQNLLSIFILWSQPLLRLENWQWTLSHITWTLTLLSSSLHLRTFCDNTGSTHSQDDLLIVKSDVRTLAFTCDLNSSLRCHMTYSCSEN